MTASSNETQAPVRIGDFMVQAGLLSKAQVEQVLEHSMRTRLRFGEAAIDCGFVTEQDLKEVFGPLYWVDYFHLDPTYFPASTKDWISLNTITRHGILLLGVKEEGGFLRSKKILNVGMLNPSEENIERVQAELLSQLRSQKISAIRPLLVLGDPFIHVLEKTYGVDVEKIRSMGKEPGRPLDLTLALFLEA